MTLCAQSYASISKCFVLISPRRRLHPNPLASRICSAPADARTAKIFCLTARANRAPRGTALRSRRGDERAAGRVRQRRHRRADGHTGSGTHTGPCTHTDVQTDTQAGSHTYTQARTRTSRTDAQTNRPHRQRAETPKHLRPLHGEARSAHLSRRVSTVQTRVTSLSQRSRADREPTARGSPRRRT